MSGSLSLRAQTRHRPGVVGGTSVFWLLRLATTHCLGMGTASPVDKAIGSNRETNNHLLSQ